MSYFARDVLNSDADEWTRVPGAWGTAEEAAVEFADTTCSRNLSWPSDLDIDVKDETGAITHWTVTVESSPVFSARVRR